MFRFYNKMIITRLFTRIINDLKIKEKIVVTIYPLINLIQVFIALYMPKAFILFSKNNLEFKIMISLLIIFLVFKTFEIYLKHYYLRIFFRHRLESVGKANKYSIRAQVKDVELHDAKNDIFKAHQAVSFGNNQGIEAFGIGFVGLVTNILILISFAILILLVNPFFCLFIILSLVIHYILTKKFDILILKKQNDWLSSKVEQENLLRISFTQKYRKDLKILNVKDFLMLLINNKQKETDSYIDYSEKMETLKAVVLGISTLIRTIAAIYLLIIVFNVKKPENIVLYITLLVLLDSYVVAFNNDLLKIKNNRIFVENLFSFFDKYKKIKEQTYDTSKYAIEVEGVCFSYKDKKIFENLNFKIEKGQKIALIGANGRGKTTLIKLLTGLYEPLKGKIKYYQNEQKLFSVAFQDSHFFSFSLAENIALKKLDEITTEETKTLKDLFKDFYLDSFISKLDDDVIASGGEKTRLAIIRAIFRNSQLLFLDEPTAFLDPISEKKLYEKLNVLLKDKTVIFSSHRLGSTNFCDKIIFIDKNSNVYIDDFKRMYESQKEFKYMYDMQKSSYIERGANEI